LGRWLTEVYNLALDAAMMARVLPKNPDLETLEEVHNTWHIENWRKMDKKSHGPAFKCGGSPWWVAVRSSDHW
jgi:hypothetical protein